MNRIIKQKWDYVTRLWVVTFINDGKIEEAVDSKLLKARALARRLITRN